MNCHVEIATEPSEELRNFTRNRENCLIQQTVEWAEIISETQEDEMFLITAKSDEEKPVGMLTAFVFRNKHGNVMISVPSFGGYGGVVYDNKYDVEDIHSLLFGRMFILAEENNCALITVSTAPFFAEEKLYDKYYQPDFIRENFYQYFDLKNDFWKSMNSKQRNNLKRNLKKAEAENLKFHFTEDKNEFEEWYDIHEKRMKELNALSIPKKFFYALFEKLEYDKSYWFSTVSYQGKIISGCLFVGNGKTIDIFMQSGDSEYFDLQGNTLLIYEAVQYFQAKGFEYLNWQSSSSRDSGVYEFKKNWGTKEGNHRYITKIVGDISQIKQMSIPEIKTNYGNRFIIPYDELERI